MSNIARLIACASTCVALGLCFSSRAFAGDYYVYSCSSYGNTAPAFTPFSNADHLSTADGCMQPAPGGGYRSLEINDGSGATVLHGYGANWTAASPSPAISIVGAYTPVDTVYVDCYLHTDGFTAEYFWNGGTQAINHVNGCNSDGYGFATGIDASFAPSSIGAALGVQGIRLTAEENSGPSVVADGSNNLWFQIGHWIRGGGWPITFTATDPSGVCGTDFVMNGQFTSEDLTSDSNPDTSSFTQCWPTDVPSGTLDTTSLADGPLSIVYAAVNAAGVVSNPSETLQVDNTPVSLSLSTPNDADPNVWVNHSVSVDASTSAGPSGIGGTSCATNGGASYSYPSAGIDLDGTGIWQVSCSSWNNSFDVNGQPARSPVQTTTVHIDETAPAVSLHPIDPTDPQALSADTSDAESGVASGEIQIRPSNGASWTALATQFDGSQLHARLNDASLSPGQWVIQATACDHAGNCSSTQENVTLPVRDASLSSLGVNGAKDSIAACVIRRAKGHRQHRAQRRRCRHTRLVPTSKGRVRFGSRVILHGSLRTAQGEPIGDAVVKILSAPDNGLTRYSQAASIRTDSDGSWALSLPAGPSRLISAVYDGSATIQPSQAWAKVVVPASVRVLRVWPGHVPWGGIVHVRARLIGGLLPPGGALVRLRLGYGNAKVTYGVREHVGGDGVFEVKNRFGPGPVGLIRHYWLQECTLPESDYPFAPACGPRNSVVVGGTGA
jgi:hypothetical protein